MYCYSAVQIILENAVRNFRLLFGIVKETLMYYFRSVPAAARFTATFPDIALADGSASAQGETK